ncbi:MAG: HAD family hydrolase [Cyanobacteria bacterium J06641_5]
MPAMPPEPQILALDFDGVLCDGLREYFQTSWRAYQQIWPTVSPEAIDLTVWENRFGPLRAVIETGWEMPLLLRAIATGATDAEILEDWPGVRQGLVMAEALDPKVLARTLDGVRDAWIAEDLDSWLGLHRFYPGTAARLQALLGAAGVAGQPQPYIVTTKEGRFARQLLAREGLEFASDRIIGKEIRQPKPQTLEQIIATAGVEPAQVWFVEDRLKTLQLTAQTPTLDGIGLFLADWGYNTARDRAATVAPIRLLNLPTFERDFSDWLEAA